MITTWFSVGLGSVAPGIAPCRLLQRNAALKIAVGAISTGVSVLLPLLDLILGEKGPILQTYTLRSTCFL